MRPWVHHSGIADGQSSVTSGHSSMDGWKQSCSRGIHAVMEENYGIYDSVFELAGYYAEVKSG